MSEPSPHAVIVYNGSFAGDYYRLDVGDHSYRINEKPAIGFGDDEKVRVLAILSEHHPELPQTVSGMQMKFGGML